MSQIKVDISDGIATITLDRPRSLNALTPQGLVVFFFSHEDCDSVGLCLVSFISI